MNLREFRKATENMPGDLSLIVTTHADMMTLYSLNQQFVSVSLDELLDETPFVSLNVVLWTGREDKDRQAAQPYFDKAMKKGS